MTDLRESLARATGSVAADVTVAVAWLFSCCSDKDMSS